MNYPQWVLDQALTLFFEHGGSFEEWCQLIWGRRVT